MSSALTWADADSIYFGGDILTMSDAQPNAQAVAVKDGKIVAVGDLAEIKAEHKVTDTQLIDLNGRTLMPGFIDAHSHLFLSSMKKATVNMDPAPAGNVRSIKDIQRNFSERLAEREEGNQDWLIGWGYDHAMLAEERHPTRRDLDQISTDIPILLIHFSTHQFVANSKMLEYAGINADSVAPTGGNIQRESDGKIPNGILEETAMKPLIVQALSTLGITQTEDMSDEFMFDLMQELVHDGLQDYIENGFTTITEVGLMDDSHELLSHMAASNQLPIDVASAMFHFFADAEKMATLYSPEYNNRYRVMGGKVNLDGGTPGRTANLRAPYHVQLEGEDGYSGFASMKDDDLVNYISGFYEKDLPLFIHALGDGAVDQAIMALSAAKKAHPGGDRRTQLIHLQQVQDDQYETLQNLDVTMTYQIAHNFYFADFHAKNTLGPERTAALNPIQTGINYGISTTP